MRRPTTTLVFATLLLAACGADRDTSQSVASAPQVTFSTTPTTAAAAPDTSSTVPTDGTAPPTLTADQVAFAPFVGGLASPVDLAWRTG